MNEIMLEEKERNEEIECFEIDKVDKRIFHTNLIVRYLKEGINSKHIKIPLLMNFGIFVFVLFIFITHGFIQYNRIISYLAIILLVLFFNWSGKYINVIKAYSKIEPIDISDFEFMKFSDTLITLEDNELIFFKYRLPSNDYINKKLIKYSWNKDEKGIPVVVLFATDGEQTLVLNVVSVREYEKAYRRNRGLISKMISKILK